MRLSALAMTVLLISVAAPGRGHAQQLSVGVRAGLNLATSDVEGPAFSSDAGYRTGVHGGVLAIVDISTNFALQTEVVYSQKGFGQGDGDLGLSVDYFEVPVLAVIKIPGSLSPHLYVGPVLGIESRCRASRGDEEVGCESAAADVLGTPRTRGADSGIMFGAGVTLQTRFGGLLLDVLYNYGLTDVSEPTDEIDGITARTLYFSIGLVRSIGATGG
jgi:hypothetical protein